jgi:hypothetical protein
MKRPDKYIQVLKRNYPEIILALGHHRTHKNNSITFNNLNYLKGIYADKAEKIVIQKGTQLRITEWLVQKSIYKAMTGRAVFYVLPTWEIKNRFVKDRIDRSIMYTPFYQSTIKSGIDKQSESSSLKHILTGSITFVGSNTPVAFISTPADMLIIDERNSCNQENLLMAKERLGASDHPEEIQAGNPTIPNFGITEEYELSNQKTWHIKCEHCGEDIVFDFFKHVIRQEGETIYILDQDWTANCGNPLRCVCNKCGKYFDRFSAGEWVAEFPRNPISGYRMGKEISPTSTLDQLIQNFNRGLANDSEMQRFYNSDLGLPYIAKGAKIDENLLDSCISDYILPDFCTGMCACGIDVGNDFHIVLAELIAESKLKILFIGEVRNPEDVLDILRRYNVRIFVIDAMPETRISKRLINSHKIGFMCYYTDAKGDITFDVGRQIINANRTTTLDGIKEAFITKQILLPKNAASIENFYSHMMASVRIYDKERDRYDWVHGNVPDHYSHAMNYMLLARRLYLAAI